MAVGDLVQDAARGLGELGEPHPDPQALLPVPSLDALTAGARRELLGPARDQPVPRVADENELEVAPVFLHIVEQRHLVDLVRRIVEEGVDAVSTVGRLLHVEGGVVGNYVPRPLPTSVLFHEEQVNR
jgi:hypothetical protein